jgi:hypothetical protein
MCKFGQRPEGTCVYMHDRTFLPSGWWNKPAQLARFQEMARGMGADRNAKVLDQFLGAVLNGTARYGSYTIDPEPADAPLAVLKDTNATDNELAMALEQMLFDDFGVPGSSNEQTAGSQGPSVGKGKGRGKAARGRGRKRGAGTSRGTAFAGSSTSRNESDWYDDDLMEQRMNNYGFTDGEMLDLGSQGVKPWDDDAWVRSKAYPPHTQADHRRLGCHGCFARRLLIWLYMTCAWETLLAI